MVRFETQLGTSKIRFRTPSPPGCTVTLDLGDGRPREWDERKARAPPARFWCPKGPVWQAERSRSNTSPKMPTSETGFERNTMIFSKWSGRLSRAILKEVYYQSPRVHDDDAANDRMRVLNDPVTTHDKVTGKDTCVWKIKESRKQAPTLSSTTAPGGATREGQSVDKYEAEHAAKLAEKWRSDGSSEAAKWRRATP